MRLAVLFSGGKDSTYAAYLMHRAGHQLLCLITAVPEREDSWMFHTPNIGMTRYQAESMSVRHELICVSGEKEKELEELRLGIESAGLEFDVMVSGVVASRYQKERIERLCGMLGVECIMPLWGREPVELLKEQLSAGFEVVVTSVSAEGLDEGWLGRRIDKRAIDDLIQLNRRLGVNVCFEGGEAETFVLDCPLFSRRLVIKHAKKVWRLGRGVLLIEELESVQK